ncbi:protein kinase [Lysobacter gummosus]|uniref:serine/threonine protein kinase n=1 Tax=Lysobacter gummosus TaxID=262324 RepID=UPI00363348DA
MTQDPKLRALSVFDDYLDLSGAAQARMRADLQQRDPELLAALLSLLAADGEASLLDIAPAELLAQVRSAEPAALETDDPRVGTRLGAWQIDGVIAEGGMGTVYAAHRADGQYEQRAALKCVRATLASPALLQAFVGERNHLARLEHPGIATLLDGGLDADGHPWFAMRYVDGVAVDAWCDRRNASVGERVDLLIQVCEALSYAHAQGIVHRDIKPSNVLVGADGRAHLVDFGISSHFGDAQAPGEHIAITPDYAAPEAREHGVHAPAADQYALGVLTYRLLCAQWPLPLHRLRNLIAVNISQPVPMDRLIDDDGAQALAHQRGARDAAALRRELAGDLSAIALKAVASLPQDRYASVSEFAQDLRRWREHRPLAIRPGSRWSRMRKWRRRNPVAALLGTTLALVVLAALGLSLWQQQRNAREIAATQTVSQLFASTLGAATLSGLGSAPFSSRALLEKTERELGKLPLHDQPGLRARSLATLARSYAVIGDYRSAERLAAQAQQALGSEEDRDNFVAATRIAMLNTQNHYAEAMHRARAEIARLSGDGQAARLSRVIFGSEIAKAQWSSGETLAALDTADKLVVSARELGSDHRELLAQVLILRAGFLIRLYRLRPAESDAREAIALARPINNVLADDALDLLTVISARRVSPLQRSLTQELLQRRRATLGRSHPLTARAEILRALSQYPSADSPREIEQALANIGAAYGREHPDYGWALSASSWAIARDPRDNIRLLREAVGILQRTRGARSEVTLGAQGNLGKDLIEMPDKFRGATDFDEGTALLERNIEAKRAIGVPAPAERTTLIRAMLLYGGQAQLDTAERLLSESTIDSRLYYAPDDAQPAQVAFFRNVLLFRRGQHAQADQGFARLIEAEFAAATGEHERRSRLHAQTLIKALTFRALYATQRCQREQALAYLAQASRVADAISASDAAMARILRDYRNALLSRSPLPASGPDRLVHTQVIEETNRLARSCGAAPRD